MLESHQSDLVDGDMAGAESPFLVVRIYRLVLHFLERVQGPSAPRTLVRETGGTTYLNK